MEHGAACVSFDLERGAVAGKPVDKLIGHGEVLAGEGGACRVVVAKMAELVLHLILPLKDLLEVGFRHDELCGSDGRGAKGGGVGGRAVPPVKREA